MENHKINIAQTISIVLSVFVAHTLVSLPRNLLISTKSATIINLIYVSIIAFFLVLLIVKLFKNFPSMDILDISEYLGGKVFQKVIGLIFISYFVFNSAILIRNFCECLKIVYYPMTSLIFILLIFIISVCIVNRNKFTSAAKVNLIVLPIAIFSVLFIFFANLNNFSIQNIFPILGEGFANTFLSGLGNIGAFGAFTMLYFVPPFMKDPTKFKKVSIISFVVIAIYLIVSITTILFMLPFLMNVDEILPLYSATRYIEFGTFFQRFESMFLLIWSVQILCYLSVILHIVTNSFKKITNIENPKLLIIPFSLLIFTIALIPKNYTQSIFLENEIYKYLVIGIGFILSILILILANLKKHSRKGLSIPNE